MAGYVGVRHCGGVKMYQGQEIQTQFFHICYMPVAPAEEHSLLVTKVGWGGKRGIRLKLNRTSVFAAYARSGAIILAVASFLLGMYTETVEWVGVALAFIAVAVYFIGFFGRSTEQEKREREVLGSITGVYASAEWLPADICESMYRELVTVYAEEGRKWKVDLRSGEVIDTKVVYAMALLNCALTPTEENVELREMASMQYV